MDILRVFVPHSLPKNYLQWVKYIIRNAQCIIKSERAQLNSHIRKKAHIWTRNDKRPFLVAPNIYSWLKIRNNYSETTMPYAILNTFWRRGWFCAFLLMSVSQNSQEMGNFLGKIKISSCGRHISSPPMRVGWNKGPVRTNGGAGGEVVGEGRHICHAGWEKKREEKASSLFLLQRRAIDHFGPVTKALFEYTTVHKFEFLKRHEVARPVLD